MFVKDFHLRTQFVVLKYKVCVENPVYVIKTLEDTETTFLPVPYVSGLFQVMLH